MKSFDVQSIITRAVPENWKDLQNRVAEILKQSGFSVEIEKVVSSVRGDIEIDVLAEETVKDRRYTIICECKHWASKIPQNVIHGFRTVISDIGANIGYIITTSDFQSGAKNAVQNSNIELLTWEAFQNKFFPSWFENYFSPKMDEVLDPLFSYIEILPPSWVNGMSREDIDFFFALREKYEAFGCITLSLTPHSIKKPSLPLTKGLTDEALKKLSTIPEEIRTEVGYIEFMEKCFSFGRTAISQFREIRDKYGIVRPGDRARF